MLTTLDIVFYVLATTSLISAATIVVVPNPIYAALALVITMITAAGLYLNLDAYFIAAVQLIVYAGAVTVLFVMVVMLFDLKKEVQTFSQNKIGVGLRMIVASIFLGFLLVAFRLGFTVMGSQLHLPEKIQNIKELSVELFSKFVFGFEAISILLLIVIVGVVAMSRSRGGTHA